MLASGDPLFYGVARFLCDKLGKDRFEVVPHVSSMQLAFARVKESWEEAYLTDLANYAARSRARRGPRSPTRSGCSPAKRARRPSWPQALLDSKIGYFHGYVCENLGAPDERVTHGELADLARADVRAAQRDDPHPPAQRARPAQRRRPVSAVRQPGRRLFAVAAEVRFADARRDPGDRAGAAWICGPTSIVWDIGAGSGSVAVEAAQIASQGKVYAIEMDADDCQLIQSNAQRFGVNEPRTPCIGRAPEAWATLPEPDRDLRRRQRAAGQPHRRTGISSGCKPTADWWPTSAASRTWRPSTSR